MRCEYCVYNSNRVSNTEVDKPWITEDCKNLYRQYKYSLDDFNSNRTNENRLKLNVAKQKYKHTETRLKRQYKNQQGNMITNSRRNNTKKFYRKFRKRKQQNVHNITLEQFKEHFSNLMNIHDNNIDRDNEPNYDDNMFCELDVPFTEPELERGLRDLKRDKSTGFDNLMNEYLITGKAYLIPILRKLFNNIIDTGI